jgi:hypothetical protein
MVNQRFPAIPSVHQRIGSLPVRALGGLARVGAVREVEDSILSTDPGGNFIVAPCCAHWVLVRPQVAWFALRIEHPRLMAKQKLTARPRRGRFMPIALRWLTGPPCPFGKHPHVLRSWGRGKTKEG